MPTKTQGDPKEFVSHFLMHDANEYSGFREFDFERFETATMYFCEKGVPKTKLNKLLYYCDMKSYKDNAISITGAKYIHLDHGPVPDNYEMLLGVMASKGKLLTREFTAGEIVYDKYFPAQKIDLSVFTPNERKILEFVRDYFEKFSATRIRDFSHKEEAYQKTEDKEPISYSFAKTLSI